MSARNGLVLSAALLSTACAASVGPTPTRLEGVPLISWETTSLGPFCRDCQWVKVAVAADGRVWTETSYWGRNQDDWRVVHRLVTVAPERIAEFNELINSVRPSGELVLNRESCKPYHTDSAVITVVWTDDERTDRLEYDFGCDRHEIAVTLEEAPHLLQISGLHWGLRKR